MTAATRKPFRISTHTNLFLKTLSQTAETSLIRNGIRSYYKNLNKKM